MAVTAEATPHFGRNFEDFLDYLNDDEVGPASISPKRFGSVLNVDMQALASMAHVHRNTLSRAPNAESVQRYLRESLRVLRAASDVRGNVEQALYWYKNHPIPTFDYKTPQTLVSEGRASDLIRYIQSLQAGFAG